MRHDHSVTQLILKVASLCNLNCSYCYVYNAEDKGYLTRPKTISDAVFDALLARIEEYCAPRPGHRLSLSFHGGEPTLIGVERFRELVNRARSRLGDRLRGIAIQTNATLLDARWADTFRELDVAVSVSLDGPAEIHDATRVDHAGRGSHAATLEGIETLRRAGLAPNILCVVNPRRSGGDAYRYFRSLGATVMSFLLPDVSHDNRPFLYAGLGPRPVAAYLIEALEAWAEEDDPDVNVHIFEGLLKRLLGGPGGHDDFGNVGSNYLVIETDGAIEGNDVLRVCAEGMGSTGLNVLKNSFDDLATGNPLIFKAVRGEIPLPGACATCPEHDICGGGYLPHRYSRKNGFDNPSVWCADILELLRKLRTYLPQAPASALAAAPLDAR